MTPTCPQHKLLMERVDSPVGPVWACPARGCQQLHKAQREGRPVQLKLMEPGKRTTQLPSPAESVEQRFFFDLVRRHQRQYPELSVVFAVPNGSWIANKGAAAVMVATGTLAGIPDALCVVPRGRWTGMALELKRRRGGVVSQPQREMLDMFRHYGWHVGIYQGGAAAWNALVDYLDIDPRLKVR